MLGDALQQLLGEQRWQDRRPELHGAGRLQLELLDERRADARVVAADVEHPEAAEHVEVAVPVSVPEVLPLRARPDPIEADRLQDARELRIDRPRPELDVLARPRRDQVTEAELAHARSLSSGAWRSA